MVGGEQGLFQLMEATVVVRCRKSDSTLVGGLIKVRLLEQAPHPWRVLFHHLLDRPRRLL
jgi:hypothetical protein